MSNLLGHLTFVLGDDDLETVVVTRHPSLIAHLRSKGMIPANTKIISHINAPEEIRGKHVIGVVPLHWAALAERVTEVPLDLPAEARGRELSIEEIERFARTPRTYKVTQLGIMAGFGLGADSRRFSMTSRPGDTYAPFLPDFFKKMNADIMRANIKRHDGKIDQSLEILFSLEQRLVALRSLSHKIPSLIAQVNHVENWIDAISKDIKGDLAGLGGTADFNETVLHTLSLLTNARSAVSDGDYSMAVGKGMTAALKAADITKVDPATGQMLIDEANKVITQAKQNYAYYNDPHQWSEHHGRETPPEDIIAWRALDKAVADRADAIHMIDTRQFDSAARKLKEAFRASMIASVAAKDKGVQMSGRMIMKEISEDFRTLKNSLGDIASPMGLGTLNPKIWNTVWRNNQEAVEHIIKGDLPAAMPLMRESISILDALRSAATRPADIRRIEAMRLATHSLPEEAMRRAAQRQRENEVTILNFEPGGATIETTGPRHLFPHGYESGNR